MTIKISADGYSNEEALVSAYKPTAMMARATVSTWTEEFSRWLNAEANRPDFNPAVLLQTLAKIHVQIHASLVHQFFAPGAEVTASKLYSREIELFYVEHAQRARREGGSPA